MCIYIYIYIYIHFIPEESQVGDARALQSSAKPEKQSNRWIVKPSGCYCTDGAPDEQSFHRGSKRIVKCRPPLGALPLSLAPGARGVARWVPVLGWHYLSKLLV